MRQAMRLNGLVWLLLGMPAAGWAAFPTVDGVQGSVSTSGTSHTINLGATPADGTGILVVMTTRGNSGTITLPSGFSAVISDTSSAPSFMIAWASASGLGSSISISTNNSVGVSAIVIRVTASTFTGSPAAPLAPATGTNSTPNPPSLSPGWGADDVLWVAAMGQLEHRTVSSYPSDYADNQTSQQSTGAGASFQTVTALATRSLNASSQDPGAFTMNASGSWYALTIAIRGTGGATQTYFTRGRVR